MVGLRTSMKNDKYEENDYKFIFEITKFKVMKVCPMAYIFNRHWTNKPGVKKYVSVLPEWDIIMTHIMDHAWNQDCKLTRCLRIRQGYSSNFP